MAFCVALPIVTRSSKPRLCSAILCERNGGVEVNQAGTQMCEQQRSTEAVSSLPRSFEEMRLQATECCLRAVKTNEKLIEINFPSVPNMATAALNQLLDANRSYTRQLLQTCRARLDNKKLWAIFPDNAEANLARRAYGTRIDQVGFNISSMSAINKKKQEEEEISDDELMAIVQPGFNVDEWIGMEELEMNGRCIVAINADLDKLRSSYYPRLFYPKLYKVKTRFISRFVEGYYLKMFSNGGVLMRAYPEPWKLYYCASGGGGGGGGSSNGTEKCLWTGDNRPDFGEVEKMLSLARQEDLLSR